jgi:hypothetical protein
MDWLILVLVTPLIIVAVVLLYGFAGCLPDLAPLATPLQAPTDLHATAADTSLVKLVWQDNSGGTTKFKVVRDEAGSSATKTYEDLIGTTFNDTVDLQEGTSYFYTVRATLPGIESGPSNQDAATTFPAAPSDVVATPQDVNRIDLNWTNNSNKADKFIIHDVSGESVTETKIPKGSAMPRALTVAEGSAHEFRVFASVVGNQENVPQPEVRSDSSDPVTAKPLAFKAVLTTDQAGLEGYCLIQRITSAQLKNSGPKVKITLRGSTAGSLTIDRIYISQVAASGNPWDSAADLTKVVDKDQGDQALVLPANTPKTLEPINYGWIEPKDLLIAFDISAAAEGNVRNVLLPEAVVYFRAATQQASVQNRYPDPANPLLTYDTRQGTHYLVEKIEVL